ncbi:hypothetical protein SARC_04852 [Sphaeroforma arctica JP610]|uniref:Uncharacterized protein n=1 Tax=Sphaeroforma arctica JP610 TaxID=667725 RepID=A0A0L0G3T2_9EUKA|nr:hypothetical protein SARC_04852 [Sphaeroforma arctica JP610]KNC82873.1 hypothetical protein SARC_04852 [Sphaeroforma arctica JP610]|eukprot:XP_014156775.1 hypothetical protein SARC_04852 [Sphaeroforma arctica JP610]
MIGQYFHTSYFLLHTRVKNEQLMFCDTEMVEKMTWHTRILDTDSTTNVMDIDDLDSAAGDPSSPQGSWNEFVKVWIDVECDNDILSATASNALFHKELIQDIYRTPKDVDEFDETDASEKPEQAVSLDDI